MKQIYILTKLFNVHDRLSSLYLSDKIDGWINSGELEGFSKCFLPYRDSNEKVKGEKDQTFEIFRLDCATVKRSALLVGYFDGPSYDSGIGFEIGFAYIQNRSIILLTSDYFEVALCSNAKRRYAASALTASVASIIHVKHPQNECDDYGLSLLALKEELSRKLLVMIKAEQHRTTILSDSIPVEPRYDIFIDFSFTKTESSRLVLKQILLYNRSHNITYYIATEEDYGCARKAAGALKLATTVLIYGDSCFDFGVDSAIIQGMAFALDKKIILFSSEDLCLYQSDGFVLHKNPMIEHSATIVHSIVELEEGLRENGHKAGTPYPNRRNAPGDSDIKIL